MVVTFANVATYARRNCPQVGASRRIQEREPVNAWRLGEGECPTWVHFDDSGGYIPSRREVRWAEDALPVPTDGNWSVEDDRFHLQIDLLGHKEQCSLEMPPATVPPPLWIFDSPIAVMVKFRIGTLIVAIDLDLGKDELENHASSLFWQTEKCRSLSSNGRI
jgi:hypothetical protein